MTQEDIEKVEGHIGYVFENSDLLRQAFVRKSYAMENGGADNEVLEFIGDKVLDVIVVKYLADTYGYFAHDCEEFERDDFDEFYSECDENELTKMKSRLVQKKMLAHKIDLLGISDFLIIGKGDRNLHVEREDSVKEDLFEAIIGAVAIDCEWDFDVLKSVVDMMLYPELEVDNGDDNDDYTGMLQDWCINVTGESLDYRIDPVRKIDLGSLAQTMEKSRKGARTGEYIAKYICSIKLHVQTNPFKGEGKTPREAFMVAAEKAYRYIEDHNLIPSIRDEIENPNYNDSINQLEILARRGYFSIPTYQFTEKHDGDGNPIWRCTCKIKEDDKITRGSSSSKKDAKKQAAYEMLTYVLEEYE